MKRAFVSILTLVLLAGPAAAGSSVTRGIGGETESSAEVPVLFDVMLMRPVGFVLTAVGFGAWVLGAPFEAITRPTDMHKSFKALVINPFRFTWVDPIGFHPDRHQAESRGEIR